MKPSPHTSKQKGFTLVEVLIAMAVGVLVLAAVAQVFVTTFRTIHKNQVLDKALTNSRLVQEHLNRELSSAISQTEKLPFIRPLEGGTSSTDTSVNPAITYHSKLTYRVAIGSVATVKTDTINSANTITVKTIGDMSVSPGDYLMIDSPNTGDALKITAVTASSSSPNELTFTLSQTLHDAELANGTTILDIPANTVITVQRQRCYEVVQPAGAAASDPYELRWYENTESTTYVVLSSNVDPNTHDLFARTPVDDPASSTPQKESSVKWRFAYQASASERAAIINGSQTAYYQTNETEGMIMPKSGNPVSSSSYSASVLDRYSGLYSTTLLTSSTLQSTTTLGTTTSGTSTTLVSTTTAGTSTTQVSTTTAGTSSSIQSTTTLGTSSTLKSTTTAGTSTTLLTSLSTSTNGTSSTIQSTTLLTSLSTSTNGTSTTLKSTTTKGTSTTLKSTTTNGTSTTLLTSLSTTTLGTSTTVQSTTTLGTSTTRLTSLSTSTNGTSSTLKSTSTAGTSTTLKTTTAGTSSTLQSTTTSGTSTTLQSTSTNGTSSTLQSSTTTQITTTISYDG